MARLYVFPALSFTDCTVAVVSFHPTTTTFKSPAVCAVVYTTGTVAVGDCGVAEFCCTNVGAANKPAGHSRPARVTTNSCARRKDLALERFCWDREWFIGISRYFSCRKFATSRRGRKQRPTTGHYRTGNAIPAGM